MDKKNAIETIKSFIENTDNVIVRDALLELYPELKASENERIRKVLVDVIKTNYEGYAIVGGIDKMEIFAWLEKQKEQPTDAKLERLKSLRPQPKENTLPVVRTKEIDEKMFNDIIARFDGEHFKYEMLQAMRTWLIELRERLRWKPSEEQIQALTVAIDEAKRCEEPYWRDSLHSVLLSLHTDLQKLL